MFRNALNHKNCTIFRLTVAAAAVCLSLFVFAGCSLLKTVKDQLSSSNIPDGYTKKEEHWDTWGFQDATDYCKYFYENAEPFENDPDFSRVTSGDIENLSEYFDDFQQWVAASGWLEEVYDFNTDCITNGDYFLIKTLEGKPIGDSYYEKFDNYSVYFFDTETCILYYIHNNI